MTELSPFWGDGEDNYKLENWTREVAALDHCGSVGAMSDNVYSALVEQY